MVVLTDVVAELCVEFDLELFHLGVVRVETLRELIDLRVGEFLVGFEAFEGFCVGERNEGIGDAVQHGLVLIGEFEFHREVVECLALFALDAQVFLDVRVGRVEARKGIDRLLVLPRHLDLVGLLFRQLRIGQKRVRSVGRCERGLKRDDLPYALWRMIKGEWMMKVRMDPVQGASTRVVAVLDLHSGFRNLSKRCVQRPTPPHPPPPFRPF